MAPPSLAGFYAAATREHDLAVRHEGAVERHLRIADRTVRLRVAGGGLADALLGALAQRRAERSEHVHATIAVWEEQACPAGALRFPWSIHDVGPGGLVRGADPDHLLAVHETYSGALTMVASAARPTLHRVPHRDRLPWWERSAPLRPSLFWALGGEGRDLVHAAAVGDDRGAVLLVGARGSGKTTVALAALNAGLGFVADDYLLLHSAGRPEVFSLYGTASVRAEPPAEPKTVLDVGALVAGSLRESLPVRAVVAPRICGGRTGLRRASPAEALRAWAPSTIFHMPFDGGAVFAALAAVVRQVPCYALDVGDDPAELASAVDRVLEPVPQ
jgi:hypothetical protein